MLNKDIKTNINNARNILVGKIPNPQMQAEHITIAMIYKFMNDMDNEAISYGGKKSFFVKELEKYSWTNLLSTSLSNQERIELYTQALDKIQLSQQVPELFRNIFKNAYLPFKDGRILTMFLQEINNISYEDSESLGDAFEYLLSILDSQGDLGSFRTPRNIINFMVDVVAPTKTDTILDPACGTAGFLISGYKYILSQNQNKKPGDKLTPKEKNTLTTNINGYDIAPEMVKLGLANLYLHGFKNPKIQEYDTLTYDTKWNETFDVILANPPFMTPKGGIKPHSLFSIQCNRSEVLFVDYVMEHINLTGRVGIIVPEGIIFQSANAYKSLRKKLIEEKFLYAVVSLPSGVFNPYAGVKTSILFMDKQLAKQQKEILFVTVENDGFDLGANRNPIDKNDLPQALYIIKSWQQNKKIDSKLALFVDKKEIANNDYNLTASRYIKTDTFENCKYEMVELGSVCEYEQPTKYIVKTENYENYYKTPVLTAGKTFLLGYTNETIGIFKEKLPVIIFDDFTTTSKFVDFPFKVKSSAMKILHIDKTKANIKYIFYVMQSIKFNSSTHKRYWISQYSKIQIPLPPIEIQNKIVKELESYQAIIDNAKQLVKNWKPTFTINPNWKKVKLGDVCDKLFAGGDVPKDKMSKIKTEKYNVPIYSNGLLKKSLYGYTSIEKVKRDAITISGRGTIGYPEIRKAPFYPAIRLITAIPNEKLINIYFLKYILTKITINSNGNSIPQLTIPMIKDVNVLLPPLDEQEKIVSQIQEEEQAIQSCKKLIEIYKQKISDKIKSIWES